METLKIIDLDGKPIEITNLKGAIEQAAYYRQIRVEDPSPAFTCIYTITGRNFIKNCYYWQSH